MISQKFMYLSVDLAVIVDIAMGIALMCTGDQVGYYTEVTVRRLCTQLCIQITNLKC